MEGDAHPCVCVFTCTWMAVIGLHECEVDGVSLSCWQVNRGLQQYGDCVSVCVYLLLVWLCASNTVSLWTGHKSVCGCVCRVFPGAKWVFGAQKKNVHAARAVCVTMSPY